MRADVSLFAIAQDVARHEQPGTVMRDVSSRRRDQFISHIDRLQSGPLKSTERSPIWPPTRNEV